MRLWKKVNRVDRLTAHIDKELKSINYAIEGLQNSLDRIRGDKTRIWQTIAQITTEDDFLLTALCNQSGMSLCPACGGLRKTGDSDNGNNPDNICYHCQHIRNVMQYVDIRDSVKGM